MKVNKNINHLLERAVSRAAESDYFLAKVFKAYEKLEGISASDLAQHLGSTPDVLIRLALCRRPNPDDPHQFKADIEQIARYFDIDDTKLAALVRYVDTLEGFSKSPQLSGATSDQGVLLTARDQEQPTKRKRRGTRKKGKKTRRIDGHD